MRKCIAIVITLMAVTVFGQYSMSDLANRLHKNDYVEITKGEISGKTMVCRLGKTSVIGATAETVWDGSTIYTYLGYAQTLRVVGKSTDDDTLGTGALTMIIYGLDADYGLINETIQLGGTDSAKTTTEFLRVYHCEVLTAGSGGENAGIIEVYNTSCLTDTLIATMVAGDNQTHMAIFTVPDGYNFYMTSFHGSQGVIKQTHTCVNAREYGKVFKHRDIAEIYLSPFIYEYILPMVFPEKTDIEVRALTTGGGGSLAVRFCGWIEEN